MPAYLGPAAGRDSDAGELEAPAELGRMPGWLLVGNRRPTLRRGHPGKGARTDAQRLLRCWTDAQDNDWITRECR
jgi:hypothetical protein